MGEWRVRRLLRRLEVEAAHDLLLPRPDRAGWTQLDHLARLPDRLLVIETKSLGGRLSGCADERTWTQQFGPCRFGFLNPLWQNALHLEAARALAGPGVRVEGMVVLVGRGWFDAGLPAGCYRLEGLRRRLVELGAVTCAGEPRRRRLDAAWRSILGATSRRWRDRRRHATTSRRRMAARGRSPRASPKRSALEFGWRPARPLPDGLTQRSALDPVHRKPVLRGLLVVVDHVAEGQAYGLDHLAPADVLSAVAGKRGARRWLQGTDDRRGSHRAPKFVATLEHFHAERG